MRIEELQDCHIYFTTVFKYVAKIVTCAVCDLLCNKYQYTLLKGRTQYCSLLVNRQSSMELVTAFICFPLFNI